MQGMEWMKKLGFRGKLIGGVAIVAIVGYAAINAGLLAKFGIGGKPPARANQAVEVKAMQVAAKDTPITYEFVGEIEARETADQGQGGWQHRREVRDRGRDGEAGTTAVPHRSPPV